MNNKLINGIIRVIISFTLIGLLCFLMRDRLGEVLGQLLNIKISILIAAALFLYIGHFFISIRLKLFLAAQQITINLKEAIGLNLIGYFFNMMSFVINVVMDVIFRIMGAISGSV